MQRDNILFIVLDQLRADCVVGSLAQSLLLPNLRALMAESVSFARHFTVATPCGPARASLLTGRYAMNHRSVRNGTPLSAHDANIALEVRKAGYLPLLFGYTDTSTDPRGRDPEDPDLKTCEGVMPGFHESVQMRYGTNLAWLQFLRGKGYRLPDAYMDLYRPTKSDGTPSDKLTDPSLYSADDSDTAFLTDCALGELPLHEHQGWFAHVTYIRPHPPFVAPEPYNRMYDPGCLPLPRRSGGIDSQKACHPFFDAFFCEPSNKSLHIGFNGRMGEISDVDTQAMRAVYFGLTSEVDHHIGRLIDYLKASGQYDRTLVIVTADHGEMLGDHFMWGKESAYDQALHVPLIIRDPQRRLTAGTIVEKLTETIDVAPTILEWLGRKTPAGFDGASLIPFLEGAKLGNWRSHVYAEIDIGDPITPTRYQRRLGLRLAQSNLAVLRQTQFKLVHFNGGLPPLLYDLENDPDEHVNLATNPAYGAELARLTARMLDHRMTHADRTLSRMKLTANGAMSARPDA